MNPLLLDANQPQVGGAVTVRLPVDASETALALVADRTYVQESTIAKDAGEEAATAGDGFTTTTGTLACADLSRLFGMVTVIMAGTTLEGVRTAPLKVTVAPLTKFMPEMWSVIGPLLTTAVVTSRLPIWGCGLL